MNPQLRFCQLHFTEWDQANYNLFLAFQRAVKCNLSFEVKVNPFPESHPIHIWDMTISKRASFVEKISFTQFGNEIEATKAY